MTTDELYHIVDWFRTYVRGFVCTQGDCHPSYQIKLDHSRRVAQETRHLASDLAWTSADANTAEAIGWLHDIGRFSQFREYGTFLDIESVDHGERGWAVVEQSDVLAGLDRHEQACILDGVSGIVNN